MSDIVERLRSTCDDLDDEAADEIEFLRSRLAHLEKMRKDAERYRYLRDATGWSIQQWLGLTGVWTEYLSGKNLDATIDAAMEVSHE